MRRSWLLSTLTLFHGLALTLALCLAVTPALWAVEREQIDLFQDGSTAGWQEGQSPNPPTHVADGGPQGTGDGFLRNESSGGFRSGSKMVMFNNSQWTGDYGAAGVAAVEADMINLGQTPLHMRIAIANTNLSVWYASTQATLLPVGGDWQRVRFLLTPSALSLVQGSGELADVLAQVGQLRILSRELSPGFRGDAVAGVLGVDNIRAVGAGESLRIAKAVNPTYAQAGMAVTYTVHYSNSSQTAAQGVHIEESVPELISVTQVISSGVSLSQTRPGPDYRWIIGEMAPAAAGILTLTGVISPGLQGAATITNTTVIQGQTDDGFPLQSRSSASIWVRILTYLPAILR